MAPTKSGETETQRSVKARYVRSTRRSTQGVTSDDVEQAKKLVDKNNNNSSTAPMVTSQSNDSPINNDTSAKSVNIAYCSPIKSRSTLDSTNSLRRFTDNDVTTNTTSSSSELGGRLSSRTDYSLSNNNHSVSFTFCLCRFELHKLS